ncbi:hypothetical protein N7488_001905 [Penicillium malachiteum]|nr:hypothetical protein N7488_001905 [Penicillium malachiteum]
MGPVFRVVFNSSKGIREKPLKSVNLDFDARVPIPFSVFPSSYRSDAVSETTQTRVEGEVQLDHTSHVEREDTRVPAPLPDPRVYGKEEVDLHIQDDRTTRRFDSQTYQSRNYGAEVELTRERYPNYQQSSVRFEERPQIYDQPVVESQLDITERDYRRRTSPTYDVDGSYQSRYPVEPFQYQQSSGPTADFSYDRSYQSQPTGVYQGEDYTRRQIEVEKPAPRSSAVDVKFSETTTVRDIPAQAPAFTQPQVQAPVQSRKMGYYDDEGQYHSFRRGVERAADRIMHPFHDRDEVPAGAAPYEGPRETVRVVEPRNRGTPGETVAIPCHFVRIGDILILQGRPCQVIRISVSSQTGQHRYLGVDLFTRQLQEESSFVSNPSPSVVVQTMLGPVFKTYRILDVNADGSLTAMTESGDIKQALPVITQGGLYKRIRDSFADGRGSVRALVINDGGRELVVDFKVIHGSRL